MRIMIDIDDPILKDLERPVRGVPTRGNLFPMLIWPRCFASTASGHSALVTGIS